MPSVIRAGRQVMSAKRTTQHHGTRASNWPDPGFRCQGGGARRVRSWHASGPTTPAAGSWAGQSALGGAAGEPLDEVALEEEVEGEDGEGGQEHQGEDGAEVGLVLADGAVDAGGDRGALAGAEDDQRVEEVVPDPHAQE